MTFFLANFGFFAQIVLGLIPLLRKVIEKMDRAELARQIEQQKLGTDLAYIALRVDDARAAADEVRKKTREERLRDAEAGGFVRKAACIGTLLLLVGGCDWGEKERVQVGTVRPAVGQVVSDSCGLCLMCVAPGGADTEDSETQMLANNAALLRLCPTAQRCPECYAKAPQSNR